MNRVMAEVHSGRKNILFGIALFLILGVGAGIPLTVDLFGGSLMSSEQYQAWKVVHAYGVFLAFINYFFGVSIDRLALTPRQKETASWCLLLTGLVGGGVRMVLLLLGTLEAYRLYASLAESLFITVGTALFVLGQLREHTANARPMPRSGADARLAHHP